MATERTYSRGDIWQVDFGNDPQDPEQAWPRPGLVVSANMLHHPRLQMVVVVPGTSAVRGLQLHVEVDPDPENGLDRTTAFQLEQVRAVSTRRLTEHLGRIDAQALRTVDQVLRRVLDI